MNNSDMPAMPSVKKTDPDVIAQAEASGVRIPRERSYHGLTKREHFAIQIYAGMMSCCNEEGEFSALNCEVEAVLQADQLLAALEES